jgi:hypothetical protein
MLSFFPTPYPDEILYSVFARYHARSGNIKPDCHWNDNLAEKDIFCFQLAIGQIMVTRKQFLKSKN